MNEVAKRARGDRSPMGGIQLICCGDFFQLPPIVRSSSSSSSSAATAGLSSRGMAPISTPYASQSIPSTVSTAGASQSVSRHNEERLFCFQSDQWPIVITRSYVMTDVFRQVDGHFITMLNCIRQGSFTPEIAQGFHTCVGRRFDNDDGILPTQIFTHKHDVDTLNTSELLKLPGNVNTYNAQDQGEQTYIHMLQSHCPAKKSVQLKIGAQVRHYSLIILHICHNSDPSLVPVCLT